MPFLEILLFGLTLAIDATAVSITNGLTYKKLTKKNALICAIMFGVFQALMPLAGYYAMYLVGLNDSLQELISDGAKWIAFVLLGILGIKMIFDAIKEMRSKEEIEVKENITFNQILTQAIATSIDALAVGFGFYATAQIAKQNNEDFNIFIIVFVIMIVTFALSLLGTVFGKKFGNIFKKVAPIIGGSVLFAIGLFILIG